MRTQEEQIKNFLKGCLFGLVVVATMFATTACSEKKKSSDPYGSRYGYGGRGGYYGGGNYGNNSGVMTMAGVGTTTPFTIYLDMDVNGVILGGEIRFPNDYPLEVVQNGVVLDGGYQIGQISSLATVSGSTCGYGSIIGTVMLPGQSLLFMDQSQSMNGGCF